VGHFYFSLFCLFVDRFYVTFAVHVIEALYSVKICRYVGVNCGLVFNGKLVVVRALA
jgi:hypothetical protein